MRGDSGDHPTWDLADLPGEVRVALETLVAHRGVVLVDGGAPVGSLAFSPAVLEGVVVDPAPADPSGPAEREDVTVVATGTKLSAAARARLSESLGPAYVVVDVSEAPPTTDVVLIHAVSPQLVGVLRATFPRARVLVAELLDDELGLDVRGPVGRLLDAGAHAYLPRGPVEQVGRSVRRVLETPAAGELGASVRSHGEVGELGGPSGTGPS
ncbi:hypothetical protein SAMN04488570_1065 [Nocardioides scoriae]|uniref:Uncharacterized protein n=1 Tax=Nocardioides scoriae TaxID=642780 RepID=A0A1H1P788_9ACTN|nr:hypothetical protein [Nocardioides scoriae]SDS07158.1 hypothetical protein SAMN04488570_1065 [Nocardioides scoriae]